MEGSSENLPLFNEIVQHLEKGVCDKVSDLLKNSDRKDIECVIAASDERENAELSEYCFRYRPQKRKGFTLLHYAMIYGNSEVVKDLLQLGADPMAKTDFNGKGLNVIHCPCFLGKLETLTALLKEGKLSPDTIKWLVNDAYVYVFEDGRESKWRWTPLVYACGGNYGEIVGLLLECKADPFRKDDGVLRYASKVSNYQIVKKILKSCEKNLKEEINKPDWKELTALHYGCKKMCEKTVKLLLSKGADPTLTDADGKTPLYYAISGGSQECATCLLDSEHITEKFIIMNYLTPGVLSMAIEKDLAMIFVKLVDTYAPAYRKIELEGLLHKVVLSDAFSLDHFAHIVKSLGKKCIEEDYQKMTPMLLAASKNMHKKLSILFNVYIEILDENMFFSDKKLYKCLYTNIVEKKNKDGFSIAHLAVKCTGSDSDFEDTIRVLNDIWNKLNSMEGLKQLQRDPFLVTCNFSDEKGSFSDVSAIELAFKSNKAERVLPIIEVTKARTLRTVDKNIIHWAILCGSQSVDFERMTSSITSFLSETDGETDGETNAETHCETNGETGGETNGETYGETDGKTDGETDCATDCEVLKSVFNMEVNEVVPLHLALKRKLFGHSMTLLKLESTNGGNVVKLLTDQVLVETTLHVALVNAAPRNIVDIIVKSVVKENEELVRFPMHMSDSDDPQINLPVNDSVETPALKQILSKVTPVVLRQYSTRQQDISFSLKKMLNDAVTQKRIDIFEMMTVTFSSVFTSTLQEIVFDKQKEEFARTAVRYSKQENLLKVLTAVVRSSSDSETIFFNELIAKMPDVAMEALNRSITIDENGDIVSNYSLLLDPSEVEEEEENGGSQERSCRNTFEMSNTAGQTESRSTSKKIPHPLDIMVQQKQDRLLQHPLVKHYLNRQWQAVGFWAYCLQVLLYIAFLGSISALVQTIRHPVEDTYNSTQRLMSSADITNRSLTIGLSISSLIFVILQAVYSIITAGIFQRDKFYQLKNKFTSKWHISKNLIRSTPEIWLQIPILALSITFCVASIIFTLRGDSHSKSLWRVGIFAIIFGWTNGIIMASKFPYIGEYALVFATICKTFLKLALFGILLILASTLVLDMIFYNPLAPNSPFATFGGSIVQLITMVTGELNFLEIFSLSFGFNDNKDHDIYDQSMAYFVWVLFLVLIPILLSNTLIALAVGDANEIQQNATIRKLELQVHWVTGFQQRKKNYCYSCCTQLSALYSKLFGYNEVQMKLERSDIKIYHKQLEDDTADIKQKYSESHGGSDAEVMETLKEVTISNQRKLRDIKISHDKALHKLQIGQARLTKGLKITATKNA